MKLTEWLKLNKRTQADFAAEIEVSPGLVSGYCDGRIWPGKDKAERIYRATSGEVTPNDFLQLEGATS